MKRVIFLAAVLATTGSAQAGQLSCREDRNTKANVCYERKTVKVNGDLRSFTMATGGPKGVDKSPYLGVVNCRAKYLELRDKRGVVFARNFPEKAHVRYLIKDVCDEEKVRPDKTLD